MLDRFPGIRKVHVLVRSRPGVPALERFRSTVLTSPALKPLVQRFGEDALLEKVNVLEGDIGRPGCGLQDSVLEALTGRVSLLLNCAGLVEFFAPVDDSFQSNVDGVEHVLDVTRRLGAKLLHVSTCFVCGASDGLVEESDPIMGFYPRRKDAHDHGFRCHDEVRLMRGRIREVYAAAGITGGRARTKEVTQRLVDLGRQRAAQWGWVNTYTYSKSLGEQLIVGEDLDWAIVRPAIVEAAHEFPFPGWVEGGRTAAPLVMMAMGGSRHWTVREENPLEIVPVDMVAAACLAAGALLLNGHAGRVYNLGTADVNPVSLGSLLAWMHEEYLRERRRKASLFGRLAYGLLPSSVHVITPEELHSRRVSLQRRLTSLQRLLVVLRRLVQRTGLPGRARLSKTAVALRTLGLQALVREQALELYQPFIRDNRFVFESENIRAAYAMLSEKDRALLPWAPERIEWKRYWIQNEVHGIARWVQRPDSKDWSFKV